MAGSYGGEWVEYMQEAVKNGEPVSLADLRQRGYKGSAKGVQGVTDGSHVNDENMPGKLANVRSVGSSSFESTGAASGATKIGGTVALDKLYGKSEPGGIHQILGLVAPVSGTDTNLFTVLGKHTARVSVLWACNRRLIDAKIRVGFDVAGGGTDIVPDAGWLYYDVRLPAESTLVLDAATGLWLGAADDVVVRSDVGGVSFGASGSEYATV